MSLLPATGMAIDKVYEDNNLISPLPNNSVPFPDLSADHTVQVSFTPQIFLIVPTVMNSKGGSIFPSTAQSVQYGGTQTFVITNSTGYQIDNVNVSGVHSGQISSWTFTNIQANSTIDASFKPMVVPIPNFTTTPLFGLAPLTVRFTDTSVISPTHWNWSFGDGTYSQIENPVKIYATNGTYTVSLTATNIIGSNTTTRQNYIVVSPPPPVADFNGTPKNGIGWLNVQFMDNSSGLHNKWNWSFGDGTFSEIPNPFYTYKYYGNYTVNLTVLNNINNNSVSKIKYINVNMPLPSACFNATPVRGTYPLTVQFTDTSAGLNITGWNWTFGDGGNGTQRKPGLDICE